MKIGIFSDIHADARSLNKALKLLERKGVDRLICCGDLVDGASEGEAACQRVKGLEIPVVMGNHDLAYSTPRANSMANALRPWRTSVTRRPDDLSEDSIAYLGSLPRSLELEYEGVKLILAHANTWDYVSYIFASASSISKVRKLREFVAPEVSAVILGHTHRPMDTRFQGLRIFNPGSVEGNRHESSRSCAVLTLPSLDFEVYEIDRDTPLTAASYDFDNF